MLYCKSVLAVLLALIFLSFFRTLGVSAWTLPQNYDWRYRVISNLLSPRDNPYHYLLPAFWVSFSPGLLVTLLKPSWATPIRSMLRHSVFWHLGFWEWTGAAAVFVFLCAAVFLTTTRTALPYADLARDDCAHARSDAVTM